MSLWMCRDCHSLQGFSKSMRCFACNGQLDFADVKTTQNVSQTETPPTPPQGENKVLEDLESRIFYAKTSMESLFHALRYWKRKAESALHPDTESRYHEHCHDLACNGNRHFPRGVSGHGCSCSGRELRLTAENTTLREALGRLRGLLFHHGSDIGALSDPTNTNAQAASQCMLAWAEDAQRALDEATKK